MEGWIKLYRQVLDNPIVCKDSDHIAVWMYLLLNATHKEYPVMFSGNKIYLQPGQLITGRKAIAEKFKISESKVQRILKLFENEQQIEQQSGNKNRLISILSWSDYQHSEQQDEQLVNNKRTTTEQQVNTNKNVKKIENVKEGKENIKYVFEYWNSKKIKVHRECTTKMEGHIKARIEVHGLQEVLDAIDSYNQVISDQETYWYSHKFTLTDFMNPKNLDRFISENDPLNSHRRVPFKPKELNSFSVGRAEDQPGFEAAPPPPMN